MFTNDTARLAGLNDIAVFDCVVECGSFTAAAQRLGLSKAVVSKYVSRLEARLGARLLVRTTRSLSLTEVGEVFHQRSRAGLATILDAEDQVSVLQGAPRGTLRINTPMSFGLLHVAPAIADFMARYPEVQVDMHLDDRKVNVVEEGFDASVRITADLDPGLVARRLAPCRHALVASPAYLERHGAPRTPRDLTEHNVITYQYQASPWHWEFRSRSGTTTAVPVSGRLQMNNSLAIREAVLAGAGITRTPTFVVGQDLKAGRLCTVLPDYEIAEISIYLVLPQRQYTAPKIRAFIDFLAQRFAGTPAWDS